METHGTWLPLGRGGGNDLAYLERGWVRKVSLLDFAAFLGKPGKLDEMHLDGGGGRVGEGSPWGLPWVFGPPTATRCGLLDWALWTSGKV